MHDHALSLPMSASQLLRNEGPSREPMPVVDQLVDNGIGEGRFIDNNVPDLPEVGW